MRDRGLIDQDRIQKMHRHSAMLWTPQHQLECKIHQRTDADCHASLANRFLVASRTIRRTMENRRSVAAA